MRDSPFLSSWDGPTLGVLDPVSTPGPSVEPGLAGGRGGARRGDLLPLHAPQALTCWAQGRWGWKRVGNHQGPGQETSWGHG